VIGVGLQLFVGIDVQLCRAMIGPFGAIQSKTKFIDENIIGSVFLEVWCFGLF
jgi:hypothetical protein